MQILRETLQSSDLKSRLTPCTKTKSKYTVGPSPLFGRLGSPLLPCETTNSRHCSAKASQRLAPQKFLPVLDFRA